MPPRGLVATLLALVFLLVGCASTTLGPLDVERTFEASSDQRYLATVSGTATITHEAGGQGVPFILAQVTRVQVGMTAGIPQGPDPFRYAVWAVSGQGASPPPVLVGELDQGAVPVAFEKVLEPKFNIRWIFISVQADSMESPGLLLAQAQPFCAGTCDVAQAPLRPVSGFPSVGARIRLEPGEAGWQGAAEARGFAQGHCIPKPRSDRPAAGAECYNSARDFRFCPWAAVWDGQAWSWTVMDCWPYEGGKGGFSASTAGRELRFIVSAEAPGAAPPATPSPWRPLDQVFPL